MKQPVKIANQIKFNSGARLSLTCLIFGFLISFILTSQHVLAATVSNVSPEFFAQYGKENAFWEATVQCNGSDIERVIQRKTDGNEWCLKDGAILCDQDKDKAAINACSDDYSAILIEQQVKEKELAEQERKRARQQAAAKPVITPEQAKLQNRISIQEQRIQLDQEKLALRRKELELERRSIEIKDILETLE